MKHEFKIAYEKELKLLKEKSAIFARDFPGIADRLGGLLEENLDPSIKGLLEGAAFMAARVQLNINQQFRTFSQELLDHICPEATAPLPSAMLVRPSIGGKPSEVASGRTLEANMYLDSTFAQAERRITCRYRLAEPVTIWPVKVSDQAYHSTSTAISAIKLSKGTEKPDDLSKGKAGIVLSLERTDGKKFDPLFAEELTFHFTGAMDEALALYDQFHSRLSGLSVQWEDEFGDTVYRSFDVNLVQQIGFDREYPLYGRDERLFPGFSTLLEYFAFPRKFLGFKLENTQEIFRSIGSNSVNLIFEFSEPNSHLDVHFGEHSISLFCAAAVNLFSDDAKPIALDKKQHRFLVSPNRTPNTHYEIHRIEAVYVQYEDQRDRLAALPLYALSNSEQDPRDTVYYSIERERRRLSNQELKSGFTGLRYEGTQSWITIYEPPNRQTANQVFVRTLSSNRHLPEILALQNARFTSIDDRKVSFKCVSGPTQPREAVAEVESEGPHRTQVGDNYWRLISHLSLSHRGFLGADGSGNLDALYEVLLLFSDVSEHFNLAQIKGITALSTKPIIRTIKRPEGYLPTRGIEISITFEDNVFSAGAIVFLSAILERFFADYAAFNTFTQCVALNGKGKLVKRWPPRGGSGPLL